MPPRRPLLISHGELKMMVEADVNWEDPALTRWFGTMVREGRIFIVSSDCYAYTVTLSD